MYDVAIIGGGASGLVCGVVAGSNRKVIILEKFDRVGKKILVTGNGRCNMANIDLNISNYFSQDLDLLNNYFSKFNYADSVSFFESLGLLVHEDEGRIYPYSNQATSLLDILRLENKRLGIEERCNFEVAQVTKKDDCFQVIDIEGNYVTAQKVVVATGGRSYFPFNQKVNGYAILEGFGHTKTKLFPSLIGLKSDNKCLPSLKGIRVKAKLTLFVDGLSKKEEVGEVIFNESGFSGICVMNLSRIVGMYPGKKIVVSMDVVHDHSVKRLLEIFKRRVSETSCFADMLLGILNKRIASAILKENRLNVADEVNNCSTDQLLQLIDSIKNWQFNITGTASFKESQVTAGGIRLNEFSEHFESKIVKGLYAIGEVLDVDGLCGGYNLQWAWTSGAIAGNEIRGNFNA